MYPFTYNTLGPFSAIGSAPPPPPPPPADPYPGAFWGFAHASEFLGGLEPFGLGFGDPSNLVFIGQDTTPANMGFGAPYDAYLDPSYIIGQGAVDTPDGLPWFADDGGDIIYLAGPWPSGKTFRVKVVNQDTGTIYPNDPTKSLLGLRSDKPGAGVTLRVRVDGLIACSLCPLPVGVYDVHVLYGPRFSSGFTLTDAFRIVYRNYSRESWNIRSNFPSHWRGMGPRALASEAAPGSNSVFPQLNYRSLTAAFAEEIQASCGKAMTRLTQEITWSRIAIDIQVETTLGFPDNGTIFVGEWEYAYRRRTPTSFVDCIPARLYPNTVLSPGEAVISKPSDWMPVS